MIHEQSLQVHSHSGRDVRRSSPEAKKRLCVLRNVDHSIVVNTNPNFGVMIQIFGDKASPTNFRRVADAADRLDFDSIWVGDHIVFAEEMEDTYPHGDGQPPPTMRMSKNCYDFFHVLTLVAERVDDVRVGSNICLAALRHPVDLVKRVFTLEALSAGFEFGVGVGWLDIEYEALGVPFEERGARTDEFLKIFTQARETAEFAFDGEFHSFPKIGFHPAPDTDDRPPLWIGGYSGAAFRRVGQYGDGWTIVDAPPDSVESARDRIANAWNDFDRDGTPDIAVERSMYLGADPDIDSDRPIVEPPSNVVDLVQTYKDLGTTDFILKQDGMTVDQRIEQMELFHDEVMPEFVD